MSSSIPPLDTLSAEFVEGMYADYLENPGQLPDEWRSFFDRLTEELGGQAPFALGPSFRRRTIFNPASSTNGASSPAVPVSRDEMDASRLQDRVDQLIRAYRVRGHLVADIDPLGFDRHEPAELAPEYYHLTEADFDRPFSTTSIGGPTTQTLGDLLDRLRNTYCRAIGVQFMHIDDLPIRAWLQMRMESTENWLHLTREEQIRILTKLTDAVIFEEFVRKKYIGSKTFSLEGAESLIPLLALAIEKAGRQEIEEIIFGMAHRGRLNVLSNIVGKSPQHIFQEFEDIDPRRHYGAGDVKYHLGHSGDWTTADGQTVHLSLCFNPSHLEFVNTVALGRMRAKQDHRKDAERRRGLVLLIHGDASFAGEGVVQEMFNQSELPGYTVGGALHVVVNNQIGFTTPPSQGRSSMYATDIARMLQVPIFHVNGENPESVAQVVDLAMDFRHKFQRDVVINMYCYRRLGHNESDEPSFTQPLMYEKIDKKPSVRKSYMERLLELGKVSRHEAEEIARRRREVLENAFRQARKNARPRPDTLKGLWKAYQGGPEPGDDVADTRVPRKRLCDLLARLNKTPDGFHAHRKLKRLMDEREKMAEGEKPLDWSAAEALAFATLATEGRRIRLSGQDSQRGTFSQRHAVLVDTETGKEYSPLSNLHEKQGPVDILNSPLSEAAVMGFDYGYSLDYPDGLIMWEAQFGDFCNAAQVIIDQFLASAEDKWRRLSGLVLLLPHGFEGQGPEHSSARLERFLALAAEDNIQIVNPSTPAQYFHCLRRQVLRRWRKPLIILTPKSLLRHPRVVSPLDKFATGRFHRVLPDQREKVKATSRILLCSGKVYYDLLQAREKGEHNDVAIVRLEQLYPFPELQLRSALGEYEEGTNAYWVQEEPENMGAWRYLKVRLGDQLFDLFPFSGITRPESASPATGSSAAHKQEQRMLVGHALEG